MPRRNHRERYEPLDLTPADIPPPANSDRFERARRQRNASINGGIDWSVCLVPGCGQDLRVRRAERRDHETALPLCYTHLATAYLQSSLRRDDELMVDAVALAAERKEAKQKSIDEVNRKARLAVQDGHIYFVRLNGLIKVGWSRSVNGRIRDYGPDVEVLAVYPATRRDETNLHQQLTPARARGREWYEDGPIVAAFVAEAVKQHGPPVWSDLWSKPKQVVAGKRMRGKA